MRFAIQTPAQFPPATGSGYYSPIVTATQRVTKTIESGQNADIIPSKSKTLTITLHQILVSWGDLEEAGKLEIRTIDVDPLVIFQTKPVGNLLIPCHDEQRHLGLYGLRTVNNSVGGEYTVTVHYTVKEH